MLISKIKDIVRDVLLDLKTEGFLEISTQELEKCLHKNEIFYSRATIGKAMAQLGIPIQRRKRDLKVYILENWTGKCTHYWIIESPNGALSDGKCKKCGEKSSFSNAIEHVVWARTGEKNKGSQLNRKRLGVMKSG